MLSQNMEKSDIGRRVQLRCIPIFLKSLTSAEQLIVVDLFDRDICLHVR
jgi:hypothetical protein